MGRKTWLWGLVGIVAMAAPLLGSRLAVADGPAQAAACGTSDNPCPLQKWMRSNMGAPMAAGDMESLGRAFDHAATLSPDPSWTTWAQFAKQGSTAAAAKDTAAVKAACKACHDGYKDKYKSQYRTRPVS